MESEAVCRELDEARRTLAAEVDALASVRSRGRHLRVRHATDAPLSCPTGG
jgi:hypothetical protein